MTLVGPSSSTQPPVPSQEEYCGDKGAQGRPPSPSQQSHIHLYSLCLFAIFMFTLTLDQFSMRHIFHSCNDFLSFYGIIYFVTLG